MFIPDSGTSLPRRDIAALIPQRVASGRDAPGLELFPIYEHEGREGKIHRLLRATASRVPTTTKVGPGAPAQRTTNTFDQVSFDAEEHCLEDILPRKQQRDWASVFDQKAISAEVLVRKMMMVHSQAVIDLLINNTNYPLSGDTGLSVSVPWSTTATSVPLDDVNQGKNAIVKNTGMAPNLLVCSYKTLLNLGANKQLRESIGLRYAPGSQENGELTEQQVAAALGIERVYAVREHVNTANEGLAASMSPLWADAAGFLAYVSNEDPGRNGMGLGRTVMNTELVDPFVVDEYPEEELRSDIVRVQADYTIVRFVNECGFRLANLA